jgi:1,4-alpha-glucan branching enzyme
VQGKLADLADLGANVIELMPALDSGVGDGWGYAPQLYYAPRPAYGAAGDLRALVDEAHLDGIAVWLDVVFNHCDGSSKAPLRCFDGDCAGSPAGVYFFPQSSPWATTPWGPRLDFSKPEVADMIVDSLSAWMVEMRGDGFRWDSVSNIRGNDGQGTAPGGRELIVRGNALIHQLGGTSVAEDLKGLAAITQDPGAGGFGFDAQWDGFGYTVADQLALSDDNARDLGQIQGALTGSYAGDPFARLIWIEDHDTVGNGGAHLPSRIDAVNPESFAARKRSMLGGVLLLTAPGVPMLFQGQDILATGTFASSPAPLAPPTPAGQLMRSFYKDMIKLRRNVDGNTGSLAAPGIDILHRNDSAKVIAYGRHGASGDDVIVIVNLRNKAYATYDIGVPSAGPWQVRLDTDWTTYGSDFGGGQTGAVQTSATAYDGQPYKLPIKLGAYSAVVFSK